MTAALAERSSRVESLEAELQTINAKLEANIQDAAKARESLEQQLADKESTHRSLLEDKDSLANALSESQAATGSLKSVLTKHEEESHKLNSEVHIIVFNCECDNFNLY